MKKSGFKHFSALLTGFVVFCGALHGQDYMSEDELYFEDFNDSTEISDPFERVNRVTFHFNDFLYLKVVEPVADGYQWITPEPVQRGAGNFFRNLRYPVRLAGNLLQGRVKGALVETGRFAVNTTVGLGGVLSPADQVAGLERLPAESVGQAFGAWGIGEGPYLVIPVFGPSNVRDLFGRVGDAAAHPVAQPFSLVDDWNWEWKTGLAVGEFIDSAPGLVHRYRQMKGSAIDPYSSLKNSYVQYGRAAIAE